MNGLGQSHFAPNTGLNNGLFAVRVDLCIDPTIAFIHAEDNDSASCPTPSLSANTTSAKVRFIQFNIAREKRLSFTMRCNGLANQSQTTVNRVAVQLRQFSNLSGSQIECKDPKKLPKFSTRNSYVDKFLGTQSHDLV